MARLIKLFLSGFLVPSHHHLMVNDHNKLLLLLHHHHHHPVSEYVIKYDNVVSFWGRGKANVIFDVPCWNQSPTGLSQHACLLSVWETHFFLINRAAGATVCAGVGLCSCLANEIMLWQWVQSAGTCYCVSPVGDDYWEHINALGPLMFISLWLVQENHAYYFNHIYKLWWFYKCGILSRWFVCLVIYLSLLCSVFPPGGWGDLHGASPSSTHSGSVRGV